MGSVRKNGGQAEFDEVYRVKDPRKILRCVLGTTLGIGSMIYSLVGYSSDPNFSNFCAIVWLILAVACFFLTKANLGGIVLDFRNDVLEFPGGGISANEIIDYIKPGFWLQVFKRHVVPLSELREISRYDKRHTRRKNGRVSETASYYIKFNGSFGAARLKFSNEGKRDELYSALREVNKMGVPVVNQ
ncbi:MAG: hypothetical protein LBQ63_00750 [Deltaproteobacteria bacterium]|jgi:hypothetical protein|nr:hypothetical protein [Deltaproteobacteria bacterium]